MINAVHQNPPKANQVPKSWPAFSEEARNKKADITGTMHPKLDVGSVFSSIL